MTQLPGGFEKLSEGEWTDMEVPITLFWVDAGGQGVVEQTRTIALSKNGVCVKTTHAIPLFAEVRVTLKIGTHCGACWGRVDRVLAEDRGYVIFIEFEKVIPAYWGRPH